MNRDSRPNAQDFGKLQRLFENWMINGSPGLDGRPIQNQNQNLPTITFPQNEPKN